MRLRIQVTTVIDGWAVSELGGELATWEGTEHVDIRKLTKGTTHPDRFKLLNPEGTSEVRVAVEEKLSGPSGTYSSVAVRVEVLTRCEQSEQAVETAHDLCHQACVRALERYMGPAMNMLTEHTERR